MSAPKSLGPGQGFDQARAAAQPRDVHVQFDVDRVCIAPALFGNELFHPRDDVPQAVEVFGSRAAGRLGLMRIELLVVIMAIAILPPALTAQ